MNSVSTITLSTSNNYNYKQTTNSNTNDGLMLSASVALVKTRLYQCWLQVYGPLFWIVSAMICLYSSNNNNTTSTTSTPRPSVLRYYSYYPQNHHHEVNLLQGQQNKCYNNEDRDYYDDGEKNDNNIIDDGALPPSTLRVRDDKQVDDLKLEVLTAPQPKKSLRRSLKLHMQSFKGSLNQVARRSTTHFQRNKSHPNNYSNDINTYYHYDNNNNNNINDESIVIHPLDFGLQSTCSSASTSSTTLTKERRERRRESFVNTVTKTKNNPIFNSFRRKTAPEIDFTIISANNNNNNKKKKNKKYTSI